MTDTLLITRVNGLIQKNEFEAAFLNLESLEFKDWFYILPKEDKDLKKKDWLKGPSGRYLWSNYIHTSKFFTMIFSAPIGEEFLSKYFQSDSSNIEFIKKLAIEFPELLLKSIKRHRSFLNPIHSNTIFEALSGIESFKDHLQIFKILNQKESKLWNEFEKSVDELADYEFVEVLIYASLWLEYHRNNVCVQQIEDEQHGNIISIKIEILNHFFSYYFDFYAKTEQKQNLEINEDEIVKVFSKIIPKLNLIEETPVFESIEKMANWNDYIQTSIEPFCFDDNFYYIVFEDSLILEKKSNVVEYDFVVNGAKYQKIQQYYRDLISEIGIENLGMIIKGNNQVEIDINKELAIWQKAASLYAKEINVNHFVTNEKKKIDIEIIGSILTNLIGNAIVRYVQPSNQIYTFSNLAFPEKIISILKSTQRVSLRYETSVSWLSMIEKFIPDEQVSSDAILSLLSIKITKHNPVNTINRFNPKINLWSTPFIEFNNFIFSFYSILGYTHNIGFALLENALVNNLKYRDHIQRKETERIESRIAARFRKAGFKKVIYSKKIKDDSTHSTITDIDLLVYEDGVFLLGEIKRTKLRLSLLEVYLEENNIISKAIEQLEKSIEYIIKNPIEVKEWFGLEEVPNIKRDDIIPLIISNSIENDGKLYGDNYRKTLLFEMNYILSKFTAQKWRDVNKNPLDEFFNFIYNKKTWWDLLHTTDIPELTPGILNINANEPVVITALNNGAESMNIEKIEEAIEVYEGILEGASTVPYFYGLLASAYFRIGNYNETIEVCDKGLNLRPDDYVLLCYKISSYFQLEKYEEYIIISKMLSNFYPFKHPFEVLKSEILEGIEKEWFSKDFIKELGM